MCSTIGPLYASNIVIRFGNRYFENMNAEEELPGELQRQYGSGIFANYLRQAVTVGWIMHKYVFTLKRS